VVSKQILLTFRTRNTSENRQIAVPGTENRESPNRSAWHRIENRQIAVPGTENRALLQIEVRVEGFDCDAHRISD